MKTSPRPFPKRPLPALAAPTSNPVARRLAFLSAMLAVSCGVSCSSSGGSAAEFGRPLVGYPRQDAKVMNAPDTVWSVRKIGPKEYFPQPNDWTCNASSYIMIQRALTGRNTPLDQVVSEMGAVPGRGAENPRVVEALKAMGPGFEVIYGQTAARPKGRDAAPAVRAAEKAQEHAKLKQLLRDGWLVMINFREPVDGGGHYGVLQGINDRAIQIADPYYGRTSVLRWEDFDFRTGHSDPVLSGWYAAIRTR